MNKIFSILGIIFIYFAISLFVWGTTNVDDMGEKTFLSNVFAGITFDSQSSNTWYGSSNSKATANVNAGNTRLPPPKIKHRSRHSH